MVRKGFYFSMDALMGLILISSVSGLITTSSNIGGVTSQEVEFNTYSSQAIDISYLMKKEDFSSLNQSYREDLINITVLEEDDLTVGRSIAKLYRNDSPNTSDLAENYLRTFRHDSGLYVNGTEVIDINASTQSSKTFHMATNESIMNFTVVVGE